MSSIRRLVLSLLIAVFALPAAAAGQQAGRKSGPWLYGLGGGGYYQAPTDTDSGGEFEVSRWFVQPSIGYAWDRRTSVSLSLGGGETRYGFSGATGFASADPWGTIRDLRVSLPIRFSPRDEMDVFLVPSIRSDAESGASLDDGRTQGALGGFLWRFSDRFAIGPGVGWFSEIEDDDSVFPILLIDWKLTDRLALTTGRGLGASRGPGLTLSWKADDDLTIGLTGRYESTSFRLDDGGAAPNGVGEDTSFPVAATLTYSPWPMTAISAFAGIEFAGELTLKDSAGRTLDTTEYDPAPIFGISFSARF